MQYSTAASDGLLALACFACVIGILRSPRWGEKNLRATWLLIIAALLLTGATAVVGVLHFGLDESWQPLHAKFSQASSLLALPALGIAAVALVRGWAWQRLGWCWVIISLSLLFEGAKRLGVLDTYKLVLNLVTLLLILYAGFTQGRKPLTAAVAVVALFIVAGLVVGTEGNLGSLLRVDVFHALLSLAYVLLSGLLLALRSQHDVSARTEKSVKTL
ncbi:hypothetical protein [Pseudomonas turukhanskensis]|uniref:Uncharacterized protein n=1 Tax=Pseudomonas turukhanskensis TaxID=1806536 RepID=A0A9W6K8R2_9PSED|nr:hypothetical protein [Pseudomonas turukhanskensis]GLK91516.1 hypothetical protein GCM10017655_45800 [Pseudomonas turukhanskensis]